MKKVRLLGQKMVSVILAATLFVAPANVYRCFAEEVSEEVSEEVRQEVEKQLKEDLKKLKKLDILYYFICTTAVYSLLLMVFVFKEVVTENATDIKTTLINILNGTKTV